MKKPDADRVYSESYQSILNTGAVGFVSDLTHKSLERKIKKTAFFPVTLEIGAGHGQHIKHVSHAFSEYHETDIRPENLPKRNSPKVLQSYLNAEELEVFGSESIDRIVASCVIIHLNNPEKALNEWRRVLKSGGRLDFYVPSEPGVLLRFVRSLTTVRKAKKLGLNHYSFHYREHRYSFPYLRVLIGEVFEADSVRVNTYPFPGFGWNLSLWKIFTVIKK